MIIKRKSGEAVYSETKTVAMSGRYEFNVLPNPVKQTLRIEQHANGTQTKAIIYELSGQKVKEANFAGSTVTVDMSDVREGVYFIRLETASGSYSVQKFIKE